MSDINMVELSGGTKVPKWLLKQVEGAMTELARSNKKVLSHLIAKRNHQKRGVQHTLHPRIADALKGRGLLQPNGELSQDVLSAVRAVAEGDEALKDL